MKAHLFKLTRHIAYWAIFVLFFSIVWGTYDNDYLRNFYIQAFSLPARLILVYVTLLYLFPRFLLKKRYFSFITSYLLLLTGVSLMIQRPMLIYYIQPNYLPLWVNDNIFAITESMNTILDVNLAAIVPCGYALFKILRRSETHAEKLGEQTSELEEFLYLKTEKTLQKVRLKDILFIEASKNYVKIKTEIKEITAHRSILSMEDSLPGDKFLRVHRSFIVGLDYVESFSPKRLEIKGYTIPVGRKYKEDVKMTLGYF